LTEKTETHILLPVHLYR